MQITESMIKALFIKHKVETAIEHDAVSEKCEFQIKIKHCFGKKNLLHNFTKYNNTFITFHAVIGIMPTTHTSVVLFFFRERE